MKTLRLNLTGFKLAGFECRDLLPHGSWAARLVALLLIGSTPFGGTPFGCRALPQVSDRVIRAELEFARGLATDWQFVELAESVLGSIDQKKASDAAKEEIGVTRCQVYASGALRERNTKRQLELYDKALQAYVDYLDEFRFAENRAQAERELVDLAKSFGIKVIELYKNAVGEEADKLRTRIQDVLTDGVGRTSDLVDKIDAEIDEERENQGATNSLEREKYNLMLNRGQMLLTIAQVSEDGTYFFDQALATLELVADNAGEDSIYGLQAFLLMGRVFTEMGEFVDATDFIGYVVETAVPSDPEDRAREDGFDSKTKEYQEAHWIFVDLASEPLIEAYLGAGDIQEACRYALHLQNCIDEYGFSSSLPGGYLSLLSAGRALMDSGGHVGGTKGEYHWFQTGEEMRDEGYKSRRDSRTAIDLALQLAQKVNKDNRGNTLQLRAQNLIAEIIDRGVAVDPEVLFEAAQGAFFQKHYPKAIEAFKQVLAVLEAGDDATRTRLGPEVLWYIGRSLQKSDRHLEAAMAFRTGLSDRWKGDPKYDVENAKQYHNSISLVHRGAGDDAELEQLYRESQDLVVEFTANSASAGDILYSQAERAYRDKDYEDARLRFQQVPGNADDYEKALAYAAVCLNKLGQAEEALAELESYLEEYVKDPVRTPTTETGITRRKEAMGLARYYGGLIQFNRAETGDGSYEVVLEWLDDYSDKFEDQSAFGPKTIFISLSCFLKLGDRGEAEKRRDRLLKKFADSTWTGLGAFEIYKVNRDLRKQAVEKNELDKLPALTRSMAENLSLYNKLAGEAKLNNLRIESKLWIEISEWATAKAILQTALSRFGSAADAATRKTLRNHVEPELAHAMLELHELREAAEILNALIVDEEFPPASGTLRNYCRAVSGWVEGTDREFAEVPGIGDEEGFAKASELLIKLANRGDIKWTCKWYELKFELAYTNYRWGQLDGKRLQSAESVVSQLEADLSSGLKEVSEACGDDILRQRFLWLKKKL